MNVTGVSTATPDPTATILKGMLTERIGKSILDSGMIYGYNYERNRGVDLDAEPETTVDFRYGSIDVTHNLYRWLKARVEFDREMDDLFQYFCSQEDPDDRMGWLELERKFPAFLKELGHDVTGIYGDGEPFVHNTYNYDDLLSQVIQFLYMEVDDEPYILLQIHGGCDVRGGYTSPRAFRVTGDGGDGTDIFDNAKAELVCENYGKTMLEILCPSTDPGQGALFSDEEAPVDPALLEPIHHTWVTDTGGTFYWNGWPGRELDLDGDLIRQWPDDEDTPIPGTPKTGLIVVDEEGNGYCPICGGKLSAWSR